MRTVLIADDHPVCSAALTMAAQAVDPATLVDKTQSLSGAEALLLAKSYDLVLLDLMLPDVQGFAGLALVRSLRPTTTVAIVSSRDEPSIVRQAAKLGAAGFLSKTLAMDQMISAIRVLNEGGQWFSTNLLAIDEDPAVEFAERLGTLSAAQLKVLRTMTAGEQNKQIAYALGLAEATVKSHLAAIFKKLKVHNRTQAIQAVERFEMDRSDAYRPRSL